jgi:hypothetical protein
MPSRFRPATAIATKRRHVHVIARQEQMCQGTFPNSM